MKKLSIFLVGALAVAAVSCEDGPSVPPIQTNPQGPVYEVDGVTVEQPSETSIVLEQYAQAGRGVPVGNFLVSDFPEGYDLKVVTYMAKDENFEVSQQVPSTISDNTVYVTPDDIENAFVSMISKSPAAKDMYVRFAVYAAKGTLEYRLGDENAYIGGFMFNITPYPSEVVIEDAYYLLGTINDWSVANAVKFTHSDANVYDDPVFTINIEVSAQQAADGWWWKIIPASTYEQGNWVDGANTQFGTATDGDSATSGILVASTADKQPGAGCLKTAGAQILTIDMLEGTYEFSSAVSALYTPGDANGWNPGGSQKLTTTNYADYYGYAVLSPGGFKFTTAPDWDHVNYGTGDAEGTISTTGDNLSVAETGLYWCHVNTESMTYELTLINTIGVIGDSTPKGWDASTPLTPSDDLLTWTGKIDFTGGEFKFRANDGWDVNLGGAYDNLTQGGENLPSPGEGTYTVTLNLGQVPYTCTLTK